MTKSAPHQWNWENPVQKLTDVSLCRIHGAALPPPGRAATHGAFAYACLCTVHVCVKDEAGRKPIPDAPAR